VVRLHLKPSLGNTKLDRLNALQVQSLTTSCTTGAQLLKRHSRHVRRHGLVLGFFRGNPDVGLIPTVLAIAAHLIQDVFSYSEVLRYRFMASILFI
jgi:hypothetical protein